MISGAARELFEELGVLAARGGDALTKGQRISCSTISNRDECRGRRC